jgi:hypothetical protein
MNTQKILSWIQKTGFPLEMEAAESFKNANFEVVQSFVYPDPQQNNGREIDVIAYDPDWIGITDISFVLECKSSSKPWVIFTSKDTLPTRNKILTFAITSKDAKDIMSNHFMNDGPLKNIINSQTTNGYSFHQAFGNKNDKAYAAVINLAKACSDITAGRHTNKYPRFAFAFPVIVIDSPLFECSRKNGDLELTEVEESDFLFSAYLPHKTICCVKVVTKERLTKFAIKAKEAADTIRQSLKAEEDKAFPKNST